MKSSTTSPSSSFFTNSASKPASEDHYPMITLTPLDEKSVIQFAEKNGLPLSASERKKINKTIEASHSLSTLAELIQSFILIQSNIDSLCGLTAQQQSQLRDLISKRRADKQTFANTDYDNQLIKRILANEKAIAPLDLIVEWWTINLDSLRKITVWKNISAASKSDSVDKNKLDLIQIQLKKIKENWLQHQQFAGLSSDRLLDFYQNVIMLMRDNIDFVLQKKKKYPEIIGNYLLHLSKSILDIEKTVMFSMLRRLQCTDHYRDITCDDLLHFVCDNIKHHSHINLLGAGKKPPLRHSLTPELIDTFIKLLRAYCVQHPEEKELTAGLKKSSLCSIPHAWQHLDEKTPLGHAAQDPIILFYINTFHRQASRLIDLSSVSSLKKLNTLKKLAHERYQSYILHEKNMMDNAVSSLLKNCDDKYKHYLRRLHIKIERDIEKQMYVVLDNILSNKVNSSKNIHQLAVDIKRARQFNAAYLEKHYSPECDIIFNLAIRLLDSVTRQKPITEAQCKEITKTLKTFYPSLSKQQISEFDKLISSLPDITPLLVQENNYLQLDFLVHYLERPFLSKKQLAQSIERHKHIANMFGTKISRSLPDFLNNIMRHTQSNTSIHPAHHYSSFMEELRTLSMQSHLASNDAEFVESVIPFQGATKYNGEKT